MNMKEEIPSVNFIFKLGCSFTLFNCTWWKKININGFIRLLK